MPPAQPIPSLTPQQMAAVDRFMVDELGVDTLQLMELAGYAVAWWARRRFLDGDARRKPVVILAGSGGNGGDGMVAARLLHGWGAQPLVWLSHEPGQLRGAAAHQAASLLAMGIPLTSPATTAPVALPPASLIVDALLGFGLSGPPTGVSAGLIAAANAHPAPVLAVDLPSGLDAASGVPCTPCIVAAATLTLALPKTGLLAPTARAVTGEVAVADIGIPAPVYARVGLDIGPMFSRESIVTVVSRQS